MIGVMWVAITVAPSDAAPPYGALTDGMAALWFLFRDVGTVVLVPLVEELFFRDYLESRLRGAGPGAAAPPSQFNRLCCGRSHGQLGAHLIETYPGVCYLDR